VDGENIMEREGRDISGKETEEELVCHE